MDRYYFNCENSKEIIYLNTIVKEEKYPNIINHLLKFKEIMEERRENKKGSREYYNLHWGREAKYFDVGEKILVVRKCPKYPIFSYTDKEAYVMLSFNVIKTDRVNIKYLLGILNSNLISFWLKYMGKMQGRIFQLDKEPLLQIPIKKASDEIVNKIVNLVDKVIELKNNNIDSRIVEEKIDTIIYDLYELTDREIEIIEESI